MHSPLTQFEIIPIIPLQVFGYDISFTNSSLMMLVSVLLIIGLLGITCYKSSIIPNKLQLVGELLFNLINGLLYNIAGKESKKYMPFIFSIFIFILICNLVGMFPFSFTVTSHIIVTFAMAIVIFIGVTLIGFFRHGFHYLSIFLPQGTPLPLAPLMIVIELFAYLVRPISLSMRLTANMIAGHTIMKVVASFVILAGLFGIIPFALLILLTGFEIFVAILQAYIFTVLSCVYLNNAIRLH